MNHKHKKLSLALTLSLAMGCVLPMVAAANNSGGIYKNDSYYGASNGQQADSNTDVYYDGKDNGSNTVDSVYGGTGGNANKPTNGNKVTVNLGATDTLRNVHGGSADENIANANTVTINGGKILNDVYGGYSDASMNTSMPTGASNNKVFISDSEVVGDVYAGVIVEGKGDASGNLLSIKNSLVSATNNVIGGIVGRNGRDSGGNANNNTVEITGGKVKSSGISTDENTIVGGYVFGSIAGNATGNTVTITDVELDKIIKIAGGISWSGGDVFTNNTLNWRSQNTIRSVATFEYYNFTIPASAQPDDILLTIEDTGATRGTNLDKSKIKLEGVAGKRKWQVGESVTLISNEKGLTGDYELINGKTTSGIKKYQYELSTNDDTTGIVATITGTAGIADYAKSLSEGRIAAIGSINTAADLASGSGLQNAIDSSSTKYDLFGAMNYSDSKYDSGSHADVKGTSMLLGFSRKIEAKNSNWVVGAFLESGNSSYDTFNNFEDGDVRANGKNNYFGGGIMARNVQNNGMYVDGSLRFGRMSTDYNSNDIETKYDIKSTYYGLHLGVGKVFKLNNSNDLDVYGKYFWSHQNAATASIDGENFNFDSINSHRLRIGARLNMLGGGNGIKTYVGLAYEHEFSGSARATYSGENIAAPSIKGATGIGEIGMVYKPSSKSAFSMDVGLNGFIGKRQGIGGGVKLNWGF